MYKLTNDSDIIFRLEDGATIPRSHRWWDEYEAWCAAGNTPLPAVSELTSAGRRTALKVEATAQRWAHETGGIIVGGITVATALDDQNRIASILSFIALNPAAESVDFKSAAGWVTLPVATIRQIAKAIGEHVQACFTAERQHHEAIEALADELLESYDATTGWPA